MLFVIQFQKVVYFRFFYLFIYLFQKKKNSLFLVVLVFHHLVYEVGLFFLFRFSSFGLLLYVIVVKKLHVYSLAFGPKQYCFSIKPEKNKSLRG